MGTRLSTILPLITCALIAGLAYGWSYTFKDVPPMLIRGFQPGAFPRLVAGIIIALSLLGLWHARHAGNDRPDALPREFHLSVLMLGLFGGLVLLGDFLFALMIGCAGLAWCWGERRVPVLLALGLVAPVVVVLFFDAAFQVRFPRGFLINLYYG